MIFIAQAANGRTAAMETLIKFLLRCYVRSNPDVRAWHIPIDDGCIIITVYKREDGDHHEG